jgi:hypothetical protein
MSTIRCISILLGSCLILGSAHSRSPSAAEPDLCISAYGSVSFRLHLKVATRSPSGSFTGQFEIENIRIGNARYDRDIVLAGHVNHDVFSMDYPQVVPQFMDLNGTWQSFGQLQGSFIEPPDNLRVPLGAKATFVTSLPTDESLALGGTKFRILVEVSDPAVCIPSRPFVVVQKRGPIEGFQSEAL